MYRGSKGTMIIAVVFLVLMAIGLIVSLKQLLIPIVILGGIFLLYKFPPAFLRGARPQNTHVTRKTSAAKPRKERPRSKTVPFRVIEGGKDDDETPKYH